MAEYQYWVATGENSDPCNAASGGQAMELQPGLKLIGISADVCYYVPPLPSEAERAMIPATYPDNYVAVSSINAFLASMGVADKIHSITGWHPAADGGQYKEPVSYENAQYDRLTYIAGGFGYWIETTQACTLKFFGKPRLKSKDEIGTVKLYKGWNLMGDLLTKVHYEAAQPSESARPKATFGSDADVELSAEQNEINMCDYLRNSVSVGGSQTPTAVDAMMTVDEIFPNVRTYYSQIPPFLQTLKYAGPGMGLLIKVNSGATGNVTLNYPAE